MKQKFVTLFTALLLGVSVHCQNTITEYKEWNPFDFGASYVGDACYNAAGGIKTGSAYLGMGNIKVGFDTREARMWKGGSVFVNGAVIHGHSPSEELVGDMQVASNIDAGNHVYMHELWYKQELGTVEITAGLQDLNVEFLVSEGGGNFINSSFGVPSVVSNNIPAPIFPLTSLGLTLKWNVNDRVAWQAAVYDGCATSFEHNVYNTSWHLKPEDGLLSISELHLSHDLLRKPGTLKLGGYYHSGLKEEDGETGEEVEIFKNNKGLYALVDQELWHNHDSTTKLSFFAQFAASPKLNEHNKYLGGGITLSGLLKKDGSDLLGVALARSMMKNPDKEAETTIELSYNVPLTRNFYIKPNLQYVINPMGTDEKLDNALMGILRCGINF